MADAPPDLGRIEGNIRKMAGMGAPVEDIDGYLSEEGFTPDTFKSAMASRPKAAGFNQAMLHGATFGFSDEVAGGGAAAGRWLRDMTNNLGLTTPTGTPESQKTPGQAYEGRRNEVRGEMTRARQESPWTTALGEGLGAATTFPARTVSAVTSAIPGAGTLGNIARNAATGAIAGGAYGAGEGEGALGTAQSAGIGAGIGGGVGAVAPMVYNVGAKIATRAAEALGLRNAERAGTDQILRAFERDGISFPAAIARQEAWIKAGAKPEMFAELGGENVKQLAATIANVPSVAKGKALDAVTQRAEGAHGRVYGDINKALKPELFYETEEKIAQRMRSPEIQRLYEEAYAAAPSVKDVKIDEVLATPAGKRAASIARRLMQNDRVPVGPVDATGMERGYSTQFLDYTKRALDDMIGANVRAGARNNVRILQGLKNDLVNRVDTVNPAFKAARAEYAGEAEVMDALRFGREFLKHDPEVIAKRVTDMSTAEKWSAQTGAARALKDIIDKAKDSHDVTSRVFGNESIRQKIAAVLGDEKAFQKLSGAMKREADITATNRMVSPRAGSQTARLQAGMEDMQADPITAWLDRMGSGLYPSAGQAALGVARGILRRGQGIAPATADAMSSTLFETAPQRNLQNLYNLAAQNARLVQEGDAKHRLAQALMGRAGLITGGQSTQRRK